MVVFEVALVVVAAVEVEGLVVGDCVGVAIVEGATLGSSTQPSGVVKGCSSGIP